MSTLIRLQNLLKRKLQLNCGGKGGKPGPCKTKLSSQSSTLPKVVSSFEALPPVKEGHRRLYHATESPKAAASIMSNGLNVGEAKRGGAEKAVYFTNKPSHMMGEYSFAVDVPHNDKRIPFGTELGEVRGFGNFSKKDIVGVVPQTAADHKALKKALSSKRPTHNCGGKGGTPGPCPTKGRGYRAVRSYLKEHKEASAEELHEVLKDAGVHKSKVAKAVDRMYDRGLLTATGNETLKLSATAGKKSAAAVKGYLKEQGSAKGSELTEVLKDTGMSKAKAGRVLRDLKHSGRLKRKSVTNKIRFLTANTYGKPRYEMLHGVRHLVVPVSMIEPGVLNGSKGRLLYPSSQISASTDRWNGMPLVGYHPKKNGRPVSARRPDVQNESGLGQVYRADGERGLKAEAWFNELMTKSFDLSLPKNSRIWNRLVKGEPVEVSTGLFTTDLKAPPGAVYNGKPFDYVATQYQPDHLAVLPDQIGACSVKDGCGTHPKGKAATNRRKQTRNDSSILSGDDMPQAAAKNKAPKTRKQKVAYLATNCKCFDEDDADVLNTFDEEKLDALIEFNSEATENELTVNAVADELGLTENDEEDDEGQDDEDEVIAPRFDRKTLLKALKGNTRGKGNQMAKVEKAAKMNGKKKPCKDGEMKKNRRSEPDDSDDDDDDEEEVVSNKKIESVEDWLEAVEAPAGVVATFNRFAEMELDQKKAIVKKLVANVADKVRKKALTKNLLAKKLDDLQERLELQESVKPTENGKLTLKNRLSSFVGSNGSVARNRRDEDEDDDSGDRSTGNDPLPITNALDFEDDGRPVRTKSRKVKLSKREQDEIDDDLEDEDDDE